MTYVAYPKWKYHQTKPDVIVHTKEQEDGLGDDWFDSPGLLKPLSESIKPEVKRRGRPLKVVPNDSP